MTQQNPVPSPTVRDMSRYDTDPDALAWARAKVQHYIDRLARFEEHATDSNSSNKARGLRVARRSAEQTLIGGEGCVIGAFDERRPVMPGGAAPAEQATTGPWPTIARLTAWLDDRNGRSNTETALRLLKVTEEAGEVAQAWIGMTGQNPRKGVTHTAADVADELCDVITAAMVALATITADPAAHFDRKVAAIADLRLGDPSMVGTTGGEQA
jgi:NTP pyrophosphatase (non-canonical NTP hydrolase)